MNTEDLPLPRHEVIRTTDLDEALEFAQQAFAPMRIEFQNPRPSIEYRLNLCQFARSVLSAQEHRIDGGFTIEMKPDPDKYSIEIPLIGSTHLSIGSAEAEITALKSAAVTSPTKPSIWTDSGSRYRAIQIHFDRRLVDHRFRLLSGIERFDAIEFNPDLDLRNSAGEAFRSAVMTLFNAMEFEGSIFENDLSAALYEEFLINSLLTMFPHSLCEPLSVDHGMTTARTVLKAEEYFQEHADDPISIDDAARTLGVSVRSLQRAFQTERNTTPMRYLKSVRLDRARARLLQGGARTNVTQIAMISGFTHLGAFSQDYRRCFGEAPSETLRRPR